jgi:hypothetical protein
VKITEKSREEAICFILMDIKTPNLA